MQKLPDELTNLIESLGALPGVGSRTATRFAMNMLQWSKIKKNNFAEAVLQLEQLQHCVECGSFVSQAEEFCSICSDHLRSKSKVLCVVENFQDLLAIERGNYFKGTYHLLGGVLNPLMGIGPDQLKISNLVERVKAGSYQDVILALNPSMEGDATCSYLAELISPYVSVERIGFGIPVGGHLEYLDAQTIFSALENRKKIFSTKHSDASITHLDF